MRRAGKALKARLKAGEPTVAMWLDAASPTLAEIAVIAGWRTVLIDNEHGQADLATTLHMLRAIGAAGGEAILRVPANDPAYIKRVLDIGVSAIMVPMVKTTEDARRVVEAAIYPPKGGRGFAATIARAADYGAEAGYVKRSRRETLVICQIESVAAIEAVPEIAKVPGVDCLFLGPNDAAGSLGKPGELEDPQVAALLKKADAAILASGCIGGTIPRPGLDTGKLIKMGYRLILPVADVALFRQAAEAAAKAEGA